MFLLALFACNSTPLVVLTAPEEGASLVAGQPITFVATITDDDPVADLYYAVRADPGDELDVEASFDGNEVSLLFTRMLLLGETTITLTVSDPGGRSGHDTVNLTVRENAAPTIALVSDTTRVAAGVSLDVSVVVADRDEADPSALFLTWEGADGPEHPDASGNATGAALYYTPGAETVTVTVTDSSGALDLVDLRLDVFDGDDDDDGWAGIEDGGADCDDTDPSISPGADEVCDGVDQDCNGVVDDGPVDGAVYYEDADGDGYGSNTGAPSCAQPEGWLTTSGDCDDTSADVSPAAIETCDGVDQDCDGRIDDDPADGGTWFADADEDGYGDSDTLVVACEGASDASGVGGDCDDTNPDVSPGESEVCDSANVDEDCDGLADDSDTSATGKTTWYRDADGDGYGASTPTQSACDKPSGYAAIATDCDDARAGSHPGAAETCENGYDDDCDGSDPECLLAGDIDLADADARWVGVTANDFVGAADTVGDQDGDGLPDLVIGAWGRTGGATASGVVYVVSGVDAGGALSAALGSRTGRAASDAVGFDVAGAGDLDHDGWDDVIIGAYGTDGGGSGSGGAYIVDGPFTGTASLSTAGALLVGESAGDAAGWSVGYAGDTDGDGWDEVLVGATSNDGGGSGAGRVYLLEGPLSGNVDLSAADARLTGEDASDAAGYSVAGVGDTDGDGYDDVLMGGTGGSTDTGTAWLLLGPFSGAIDLSAADATLTGATAGDAAGTSVSAAGDTDGDGYADVLIGAPQVDGVGSESGAAYLVLGRVASGRLSSADAIISGLSAQDRAGYAVGGGGDSDGDGRDDVIVGAYYEDSVGTGAGASYLLYGPVSGSVSVSGADATFFGESARDASGKNVGFAGDTDGDGFDDLWIGAPGYSSSKGAVYVFRGGDG